MIRGLLLSFALFPMLAHGLDELPTANNEETAKWPQKLIGKWKFEERQGANRVDQVSTFRADGSAEVKASISLEGQELQTLVLELKWQLAGEKLTSEVSKSSIPRLKAVGEKWTETVVSVSDEEFRYLNKLGEARVEKRLADKGFIQDRIVLAQPDDVLKQRIKDVSTFADYISKLQDTCTRELSGASDPANFNLVVLVRPGKQSKAWLATVPDVIQPALSDKIRKQLEAVPPLDIDQGPVALAIVGTIAGGVPDADRMEGFPTPKRWIEAAKGKGSLIIPDGFAPLVWPETP